MKTEEELIKNFEENRNILLTKLEKKFVEAFKTQEVELPVKYYLFGGREAGMYLTGLRYNPVTDKIEYHIQSPLGEAWKDESSCNDEERKGILWEKRTALTVSLKCDNTTVTSLNGEELDRKEYRSQGYGYTRKIFGHPTLMKEIVASEEENIEQEDFLFQELKKRFLNKFGSQEVEFQCSWLYIWKNYDIIAYVIGIKYDSSSDKFLYKFKYSNPKQEVWEELEGKDPSIIPTISMSNHVLMVALNVKSTYTLYLNGEELEKMEHFMRDDLLDQKITV